MLSNRDAVANVAVKDLNVAKQFYAKVLGLEQVDAEGDEVAVFRSGSTKLNVYRSQFAGTNQATAVTWAVGDQLDKVMSDLKGKGVRFEHYDLPGTERKGDVHIAGDMKLAWFKDPDGNILHVINR